jgi:hypothetical protein
MKVDINGGAEKEQQKYESDDLGYDPENLERQPNRGCDNLEKSFHFYFGFT